jgi:hypothetical protein
MNRATRDRFTSGTRATTAPNALWQTPPAVYEKLAFDFGPFDVDLTADAQRHLAPRWFGPGSATCGDALLAPWAVYGRRGYSNPPYGPFVQRIIPKALAEAARGFTSVFLLPLRVTDTFKRYIVRDGASDLLFCDTRICFYEDGHPRWNAKALAEGRHVPDSALFDSVVVIFQPGVRTGLHVDLWKVPPHATIPRALPTVPPNREVREW